MEMTPTERRRAAAERYRPEHISTLLVAEAPPLALDRYFYFEDVPTQDSLFRYVAEGILGTKPDRDGKPAALAGLRDRGFFLIDFSEEPIERGARLSPTLVPGLVERAVVLKPDRVILIKTSVYDLAYHSLAAAGLRVVDQRIPFPGSGQQVKFREAFAYALAS
jgi:hypothetical protein